jgi:predicted nucleic acid-binding protein
VIVVSNATPLIALARISRLDLLKDLFGTVAIPRAVYDEVVSAAPTRAGADQVRQSGWIQARHLGNRAAVDYLRSDLDAGEAEVLVLAQEMVADIVLLDEPKARLAAALLGLQYVGTVGLLLLCKQTGRVPAVRPLLDALKADGFHLSDRVYRAVTQRAGEQSRPAR